jgi:phenylacetate-CoA ligase
MIVYPSSAFLLATLAREQNITLPPVRVIFSNAEKLQDHQKNLISEVFQCPVVDTYGMGEYAFGASECQRGSMHIWPEIGLLEVMYVDDDKPVNPGENGRFIVTSLLNEDMPLIRYEVGDLGNSLGNVECACGRSLPRIGRIEGRLNDMLYTPDGRQIFWLNPIFYGLSIREAQIIQESLDQITVNYVPAPAFRSEDEQVIRSRIQTRTGIAEITIKPVQRIPRDKNGKFRAVISKCRQ